MKALAAHLKDHTASAADARGYQPRQLVLLGGGMANLQVLADLAVKPLPEMRIILVAPQPRSIYPGMLAGMVAGRYSADECAIPLEPLVRRAGIRWLQRQVTSLDTRTQTLRLDDGSSQHYDWLSINTGPVQNRDQMDHLLPGAREHGLFVHPMETFAALWPRVCELSQSRALRVAVIGSGTAAMELALAVRQRMPDCAVTWVAGPLADTETDAAQPTAADTVITRLTQALKAQRITVLYDTALSLKADEVQLGCGARLACDVPLIATAGQTPAWLADSGLALGGDGQPATDHYQRSTSHPEVFSVTDSSLALAHNLPAATTGGPLHASPDPDHSLRLLFGGNQQAVAGWGHYSAQGRVLSWLKSWTDRRFVARYLQDTV
jgi:NADH dehydrogenase FAD-containing subunit